MLTVYHHKGWANISFADVQFVKCRYPETTIIYYNIEYYYISTSVALVVMILDDESQ